jgi:hypothetical protein
MPISEYSSTYLVEDAWVQTLDVSGVLSKPIANQNREVLIVDYMLINSNIKVSCNGEKFIVIE